MKSPERPRLYLIVPPETTPAALLDALAGGDVAAVELAIGGATGSTPSLPSPTRGEENTIRSGEGPPPPLWGRVGEGGLPAAGLVAAIQERGVAVLLRDDARAAAGADGVYLADPAADVAATRAVLGPEKIVGAFASASRHAAMVAGEAGADFVAFEHDLDTVAWWAETMVVPSLARGGIMLETVLAVVAAGADFIGVDRAVWTHPDGPRAAIAALNAAVDIAWSS